MAKPTHAELEADVAQQREALAATVTQLHTQVQARAVSTAQRAAVVAGVAAVLVAVLVVVRRRTS